MKDEDIMTIRQMCEAFGVTARTLRYYETKELLSPAREGQKRLYSNRERARLKLILRGKRFGFDLGKIRQILDLYNMGDAGKVQLTASLTIAKERFVELTEQRDELKLALTELAELIKWCEHEVSSNHTDATHTASL